MEVLIEYGAEIELEHDVYGPPVVAASFFGHTEAALLLLKRGASPSIRSEWWENWTKLTKESKRVPGYLEAWQKALTGRHFATLNELINGMSVNSIQLMFDSFIWEWELPAIMRLHHSIEQGHQKNPLSDFQNHVTLVRDAVAVMDEDVGTVTALTCSDFLKRSWEDKWSFLILELVDVAASVNINPEDPGMYSIGVQVSRTTHD